MDFTELARKRYSVRDYSGEPVSDGDLDAVIGVGMLAPTGKNIQPQRVYVIRSPEGIAKARSLTRMAFNAPVVLMVSYKKDEAWVCPFDGHCIGETDVAIVSTHMMLKAAELGLGTCWIGYFDSAAFADAFGVPEDEKVVHLMTLGHPSEKAEPSPMHYASKAPSDVVRYL